MKLRCLALAAFFALAASPARADLITFNFTAAVDQVSANAPSFFNIGQVLTGSLSFDSAAVDQDPLFGFGKYALSALTIAIGGDEAASSGGPDTVLLIRDNFKNVQDQFNGGFDNFTGLIGGFTPTVFNFGLSDSTQTVFSSDALPLSLDVHSFDRTFFALQFLNIAQPFDITGSFTSVTVKDTPEPASLALMGVGLLGIVAVGGKQLRKRRG